MMNEVTGTAAADGASPPPPEITGEPRVDDALARLADLGEVPDAAHVAAFEHVYDRLHSLLGELEPPG
jgi:hypothetical protein